MRKRFFVGAGIILVLAITGWIYSHYHYSPPDMSDEEIVRLAEIELEEEAPSLLQGLQGRRDFEKKLISVDILDINQLGGRTYVIFKLNYDLSRREGYDGYDFNTGNFMLGYRMAEKKWGGISLRDGMEFETSYMGIAPVECGHHPGEGIFYGFCKDPRVSKVVLEIEDQPSIEIQAENRIIFGQVPREVIDLQPHFYTAEGSELEPVYGLRVAMVSDDEKTFEKFTHTPLNWWPLTAEDLSSIDAETADAVWIFPDQQEKVFEKQLVDDVKSLVNQGIPVLFTGIQDIEKVTDIFSIKQVDNESTVPDNIEAIYLTSDADGQIKAGVVAFSDSEMSPLAEASLSLRYKIEIVPRNTEKPKMDEAVSDRVDGSVVTKEVKY